MRIDELYEVERVRLTNRIARMVGAHAAEDVVQEAFVRAWQRAPEGMEAHERVAWLNRAATNLAIDELRRRGRRQIVGLDELEAAATARDGDDVVAARDALAALTPHERMVLLLRFELGLAHAEIGALLDTTPEAARKRVERARRSFARALREGRGRHRPVILLAARMDYDAYRRWLEDAGAEVRPFASLGDGVHANERELAGADGVVIGGSVTDMHPALYGERQRQPLNDPDLRADLRDYEALRAALRLDLPIVGICRGHQLLNVALGGSLFQDLSEHADARHPHWGESHAVDTAGGSFIRGLLGRRPEVASEHHQAVRRVAPALRVTSRSDDGVVESVELPGRRLTLGLQWHPEVGESGEAGRRVAAALVEAAAGVARDAE